MVKKSYDDYSRTNFHKVCLADIVYTIFLKTTIDIYMKGVILENYTKSYEDMRTALIAAAKQQKKTTFFPVDFKIPNTTHN